MERGPQKSARYKALAGGFRIPRECYLKTELADFLRNIHSEKSITVRGYQTVTQKQEIQQLAYFSGFSVQMRNGHVSSRDKSRLPSEMLRCLTLEVANEGVKGAIEFSINLEEKTCRILFLAIDPNHKRKHFGSILIHTAIFTALHYQCAITSLVSSTEGMNFYPTQGFKGHRNFVLNLNDVPSRKLFLERAQETCPTFTEETLTSLLKAEPDVEAAQADEIAPQMPEKIKTLNMPFNNFIDLNLINLCIPNKEESILYNAYNYKIEKNINKNIFPNLIKNEFLNLEKYTIYNIFFKVEEEKYKDPLLLLLNNRKNKLKDDISSDEDEPPTKKFKTD